MLQAFYAAHLLEALVSDELEHRNKSEQFYKDWHLIIDLANNPL